MRELWITAYRVSCDAFFDIQSTTREKADHLQVQ
jgi:hypothetical protein